MKLGAIAFCPPTFLPFGVSNEMLKYGGSLLVLEVTRLIQQIFISCKIPEDCRTSITVPIFKMGDKILLENYRVINLSYTLLKVTTKVKKPETCIISYHIV
jgi:hypothetical protein